MQQPQGIPDHLHRALDELGVVGYHQARPKRQPEPQQWTPAYPGEEPPF